MDLNRFTTHRRSLLLGAGALGLAGCAGLARPSVAGSARLIPAVGFSDSRGIPVEGGL